MTEQPANGDALNRWLQARTLEEHLSSWESEVRALHLDKINGYDSYVGGVLGARERITSEVEAQFTPEQRGRLALTDKTLTNTTEPDTHGYVSRVTRWQYLPAWIVRVRCEARYGSTSKKTLALADL